MRVTIITNNLAAQNKPYEQGKQYELTPYLAELFIARGWAKPYERKRRSRVRQDSRPDS